MFLTSKLNSYNIDHIVSLHRDTNNGLFLIKLILTNNEIVIIDETNDEESHLLLWKNINLILNQININECNSSTKKSNFHRSRR